MKKKTIGIIGGMGPEATASLFMKIIKMTRVEKDQDHYRTVIESNPQIPDRTEAIFQRGPSPVPLMTQTAKNLELLGVDVAGIPCITAHYFIDDVQKSVSYPIINALKETEKKISTEHAEIKKIGVLATSGSIGSRLYNKYFLSHEILYPPAVSLEKKVMEAIYGPQGIKRGNLGEEPTRLLLESANELIAEGAQLIIAGCTEIPLVLKQEHLPVPLINPMDVLAEALVKYEII